MLPTTAAAHDEAQARISGLPHLLATALAVAGGIGGPLAGALAAGSFRDGTRVAGTRPELVAALCDGNRVALARVLDETLAELTRCQGRAAPATAPCCRSPPPATRPGGPGPRRRRRSG